MFSRTAQPISVKFGIQSFWIRSVFLLNVDYEYNPTQETRVYYLHTELYNTLSWISADGGKIIMDNRTAHVSGKRPIYSCTKAPTYSSLLQRTWVVTYFRQINRRTIIVFIYIVEYR